MTIRQRKRATPALNIFLAATILALVVFGWLFASERDWLSGIFTALAAIGSLRMGALKLRLMRQERQAATDLRAAPSKMSSPTSEPGPAFVTAACQGNGVRVRDGYLVIGREVAGFVPTGEWRNALVQIGAGLLVSRVDLTRMECSAIDSPELADELAALVQSRDGILLDQSWVWSRPGKWLAQPSSKTLLTLNDSAPSMLSERWKTVTTSAAKQHSIRRRVLWVGAGVVSLLVGVGVASWRLTGNSEFLIAGISFAALVAISVAGALIAATRMLPQSNESDE